MSRFTLLLLRRRFKSSIQIRGTGNLTSVSSTLKVDPSLLVSGVTKERLDSDPALAEYFMANFPEAFEQQEETSTDDIGMNVGQAEDDGDAESLEEKSSTFERREKAVYPLNIRPLTTYLRDETRSSGTRNSKRLRYREGMIPGLLHGGNPNLGIYSHQPESKTFLQTPWKILQRELDKYHNNFESRVYDLTVLEGPDDDSGGTVHRVVPHNVNKHPVMSTVYCANFVRYHAGRPLKLPLKYINEEESPTLKRGDGFMVPINRFIECFIEDGADIPEALEVEVSYLLQLLLRPMHCKLYLRSPLHSAGFGHKVLLDRLSAQYSWTGCLLSVTAGPG